MTIQWETDLDFLALLPSVAISILRCSNDECGEAHGFAVTFGWFVWTAAIIVRMGDKD